MEIALDELRKTIRTRARRMQALQHHQERCLAEHE